MPFLGKGAMEYVGVKETADTWGFAARTVLYHCTNDRIKGAHKVFNVWLIPKDAAYLEDGRKRNGRKPPRSRTERGENVTGNKTTQRTRALVNDRRLSVIVFSLFFAWLLAFPFEGQILYALAGYYQIEPRIMVFGAVSATFCGLFSCGFFIKSMKAAKKLMLGTIVLCIVGSSAFLFPPSGLWLVAVLPSSFLAGGCVAAWGYYLWSGTPKNERIKTAADGLIYSNILMILLNMAAIHISPRVGLSLSMLTLGLAFLFALRLPESADTAASAPTIRQNKPISIVKPLAFLCLFVIIITINSGLMYQVLNPAYAHLTWLTSWYWAIPYIAALFVMRNLPRKTNRTDILFVAIAMIGFSFIAFICLDHSAISYFIVNTLMLGACGVYDLFWWSILGEMLDFHKNPAKVLGVGLSANVLGVLLGGLIGNVIASPEVQIFNPTLLALAVVCVTLVLLPPLHRRLSSLLKNHAYLSAFSELPAQEQTGQIDRAAKFGNLSERESQVAALLLQAKTYKAIAGELMISENTVKYYIKNVYSKFGVQSRTELINIVLQKENTPPTA
jgi:DNA-binding CsgD family transcriptional regulator